MNIWELETIDLSERVSKKLKKESGVGPYLLSYWNPEREFLESIPTKLKVTDYSNHIDYVFSSTLEESSIEISEVIEKLGFSSGGAGGLVTPSGSASLNCVINWLKQKNVKKIISISPDYFSVKHICNSFEIEVENVDLVRNGEYFFPDTALSTSDNSIPVWITNPVYNTGVYFQDSDIQEIENWLIEGRTVILDECLALSGMQLGPRFQKYPNFIGIYAPHKTICVNGVKFSIIVCNKDDQGHFDQWADALYGCLSTSTVSAIKHYLSPNFKEYETLVTKKLDESFESLVNELSKSENFCEYDTNSKGYLRTLYFPWLASDYLNDPVVLEEFIRNTQTTVIAGNSNHFPEDIGFCFRINLMRDSVGFRDSIKRVLKYLSQVQKDVK